MMIKILALLLIGYAWLWVLFLLGLELWFRSELRALDRKHRAWAKDRPPFSVLGVIRGTKTIASPHPADFL